MMLSRQEIIQQIQSADLLKVAPQILAVSKLQPLEKMKALYQQGQRLFAENYSQEARPKQESLQDLEIEWHFIGRLQKNKVKDVVGTFSLIHSVDSLALAQSIEEQANRKNLTQKILLQVNLSGESSKGGFAKDLLLSEINNLKKLTHIEICGLMTMPPINEDPERTRTHFRSLRSLRDHVQSLIPTCQHLSMGTSSDYLIAVEEGATIVRLGTLLFGDREKN